jgi:hypothetical protein
MTRLRKNLLIAAAAIVIIVVLLIAFISPITKYLVQKYDEKYLGRQITLGMAYVNPFTGYVYLTNLKIYESKSDSIFLSANSVSANFEMMKLFRKTYEISQITLNKPRGIIIQNKTVLNFNDIVTLFTPKEPRDTTKPPVHFNILKLKINDGEFHYRDEQIPVNYFIKNLSIESTGLHWNADTTTAKFSFQSGIGNGDVEGNYTININTLDYRFDVVVKKFDLNIIEQYLKDLTNYGTFTANLDADVKASGNFNNQENLTASGMLAINEFHFGEKPGDDFAAFEKLKLDVTELSPEHHRYLIDSVLLSRPFFKYERYDYLDNLQTMFGKGGENLKAASGDAAQFNLVVEIAKYVEVLAKNFMRSDYKIHRLAITNSDVKFNDFSTSEKFAIELNPLNIEADSIDKDHSRVNISLASGVKPYGNVSIALSINPKDSSDFDLKYHLKKLPASLFNPYTITYTSFPLDRGTIDIHGTWNVRNGIIKSDNHLVIIDPRVANRLRNKENKWIPVPLIMAFVRERGNVIDYEIPITGDLKDPKFNLWDVVFDVLGNVFVKPATTAYIAHVKNVESDIEKSLALTWNTRSSELSNQQERFIEKIADFLEKNREAIITVSPQHYALKEKEYILFFEAKKKYFLSTHPGNVNSFSEADSITVSKMSIKQPAFVAYLKKQVNDSMLFTIQEKCAGVINASLVNSKFEKLNKERVKEFRQHFDYKKVGNRLNFSAGENTIPYNGFSFYKIDYEGEFPESLTKAYLQMNELNDASPRKQYQKDRKNNAITLD